MELKCQPEHSVYFVAVHPNGWGMNIYYVENIEWNDDPVSRILAWKAFGAYQARQDRRMPFRVLASMHVTSPSLARRSA